MDVEFVFDDLLKCEVHTYRSDSHPPINLVATGFFPQRSIGLAVIRCFRRFRKYSVVVAARLPAREGRRDIKVMKEFGNFPQIECYAGLLNQAFLNIINHVIVLWKTRLRVEELESFNLSL